jgi:osmoprotectant transport system permease protein
MDAVLVLLERLLTPWTRAAAGSSTATGADSGAGQDKTGQEKTGPAAAALRLSDAQTSGGAS